MKPLAKFTSAAGAALITASFLAACGGGGAGSSAPAVNQQAPAAAKSAPAQFTISIPNRSSAAHVRKPMFVSSGTNGLSVSVAFASAPSTSVGSSVIDVSSASSSCTAGSGGRTCSIYVNAPVSPSGTSDVFTFTSYDTAPASGAIPSSAKVLAIGSVSLSVVAGQTNTFNVSLSGTPATLTFAASSVPFVADQGAQTIAIGPTIKDASGQIIVGTYATPVTVTVADTGNHTALSTGGSAAASIILGSSTDASALNALYDGKASGTYSFALASGSASETYNGFTISGPSSYGHSALATTATVQSTLTINEANFTGTFTQSNTCSNTAVVNTVVQQGATATLGIVGALNAGTCTVTISDGTLSYPVITISNTVSGTPLPLPTGSGPPGGVAPSSSPLPLPTSSAPVGGVTADPSASPIPLPT